MDRVSLLNSLGYQRRQILSCLGGDLPNSPGYFEPDLAKSIFASFREYTERLSRTWSQESDASTIALLAAGRLLSGDLQAAGVILDCLPACRVRLDHGAGICLLAPFHALSAVLPLPLALKDAAQWLNGSPQHLELRAWLSEHRQRLRWNESEGVYQLE